MYTCIVCQQIALEVAITMYSCNPLSNLLAMDKNELCLSILHLRIVEY